MTNEYQSAVLLDNPYAFWEFSEVYNTGAVPPFVIADSGGNGRTMQYRDNVFSDGTAGGGIFSSTNYLQGDAQQISSSLAGAVTQADWPLLSTFTIEMWINAADYDGSSIERIASWNKDGTGDLLGWHMQGRVGSSGATMTLQFAHDNGSGGYTPTQFADVIPVTDTWHHVVVAWLDATSYTVYVDGVSVGTVAHTHSFHEINHELAIGFYHYRDIDNLPSDIRFDMTAMYDYILPDARVLNHYQVGTDTLPVPAEPGPILGTIGTPIGNFNWWDVQAGPPPIVIPDATVFLEFEAEPLVDSGVGNNNISHQGEIIPISSGATDGLHGEYLDFTGLVTTGNTYGAGPKVTHFPISTSNATVTYSVWFKGFAPASSAWVSSRLVCRGDPSINSYKQGIEIVPDGRVRGRSYDDNNASYILETTLPVDSNWHHVLFRQVGTTLSFWVDGVRIPDTIMPSYSTATMNNFIEIGHQTRQDSPAVPLERGQYGGKLDSVEVWDNIILTDEQAEAVYTQGKP